MEAGGVEPLASEQGAEFSGSGAGVGFLENAQFVGGGEASSCRLLADLGVWDGILALERRNRKPFRWAVAVLVRRFDNECVHGKCAFSALAIFTILRTGFSISLLWHTRVRSISVVAAVLIRLDGLDALTVQCQSTPNQR